MALVTQKAYTDFWKDYKGDDSHTYGATCHLTSLLSDTWADCRDMSAVVQLYTRVLGGANAKVRKVEGPFDTNPILPISAGGSGTWATEYWEFHQFGSKSNVYDACLMLDYSSPRVPVDEDLSTTYKNDLLAPGETWTPGSEFSITNFD